jgi:hypothetical protein
MVRQDPQQNVVMVVIIVCVRVRDMMACRPVSFCQYFDVRKRKVAIASHRDRIASSRRDRDRDRSLALWRACCEFGKLTIISCNQEKRAN